MFYAWPFIHNTEVPIYIKQNKYHIFLNTHTTVFAWGAGNSNKTKHKEKKNVYYCDYIEKKGIPKFIIVTISAILFSYRYLKIKLIALCSINFTIILSCYSVGTCRSVSKK